MPTAPSRPCAQPGCPEVAAPHSSRCTTHAQAVRAAVDARRGSSSERGYGTAWQRLRRWFLKRHPLCVDPFGAHGAWPQPATDVDHIVPRARGGTDDESNLQALCHECHSRKTALEDSRWG